MKILIDTQVLVWLLDQDKNLGVASKNILSDKNNRVFVSYFSFFEIVIKSSIGKITFDDTLFRDLPEMGIELIDPTVDVLKKYTIFNSDNKDPFDNILIATALNEKCFFMTADEKILKTDLFELKLISARL